MLSGDVFLKLGKLMVDNKYINNLPQKSSINNFNIQEYKINYELKLNQQLVSLKLEIDDIDNNICDIECNNNTLNIFLNNKYEKHTNYKMYKLNKNKLDMNNNILEHLIEKKKILEQIVKRIEIYKYKIHSQK